MTTPTTIHLRDTRPDACLGAHESMMHINPADTCPVERFRRPASVPFLHLPLKLGKTVPGTTKE